MVGRYRSDKGINYPFDEELSKLDKKLHLHIDFDSIIKEGYKIIVLNQQPGIGKTHTVMNYIMNKCKEDKNFTFYYFTDRHKTIKEHLDRLKNNDKKTYNSVEHWKGFGKHCEEHPESENIDKLLGFNVPSDRVKDLFKLEDYYNTYQKQFDNTKRVFAPFQYLSDDHFLKNPPNIVFLDERISQIETYTFDGEEIAKGLELIKAPQEYIDRARRRNKEDINFFRIEKVKKEIKKLHHNAVIGAVKQKRKHLEKYKRFNPYKLFKYLEWGKIYKYNIDSYSLPFYYKALDVLNLKKVPLVIMDATFNRHLFSYFLESYNGEMKQKRSKTHKGYENLKVKILTSNVTNDKTIIYRMHPKGVWPKFSFTTKKDTTWPWLLSDLHRLRRIFGDANIGIITHKELSWLFESMNFDVEYYGNLRGTNKLENKQVLVIIGTWLPLPPSWEDSKDSYDKNKDYIDYLAKKYFLANINKEDTMEVRMGAPMNIEAEFPNIYKDSKSKARVRATIESKLITLDNNEGIVKYLALKYADKANEFPLSMINSIWYEEIYQAFHRNRGLRNQKDQRIIFSYAWFPEPKMNMILGDKFQGPETFTTYNLRNEFKRLKDVSETDENEEDSVVKVMKDEDRDAIFDRLSKEHKSGLMQELMKYIELDENSKVIAKSFHIYKKNDSRTLDTIPITAFKKVYNDFKNKILPHRKK
jgi:hypothetical protein